MLKLKIRQLIESQGVLAKLICGTGANGEPISPPQCSVPMAYSLWLIRKGVVEQMEFFDGARQAIVNAIGAENLGEDEIEKRYAELINTTIKIPNAGRIAASKIQAEGIKLNAVDFQLLDWLIKPDVESVFEPDDADNQEETNG